VDLRHGDCDCPGATYRKRACKHSKAARAVLAREGLL
jgi:hypothetical protein